MPKALFDKGGIMNKKICSISILLIFLLVLPFTLVACDKVHEKYKMKNFYGTYDQFANDYFTVFFTVNGERGANELSSGWWKICELKDDSFICIDHWNEKKEQQCDSVLISKIRELQQKVGSNVTIERKKMTFVNSDSVVKYAKTKTVYTGHEYLTSGFDSAGEELFSCRYSEENNEEIKILTISQSCNVSIDGDNEWGIKFIIELKNK